MNMTATSTHKPRMMYRPLIVIGERQEKDHEQRHAKADLHDRERGFDVHYGGPVVVTVAVLVVLLRCQSVPLAM